MADIFITPYLSILFLIALFSLMLAKITLSHMGSFYAKELIKKEGSLHFFFPSLLKKLFPRHLSESLFFSLSIGKLIYAILFSSAAFYFGLQSFSTNPTFLFLTLLTLTVLTIGILTYFVARSFATYLEEKSLYFFLPISFGSLLILSPLLLLLTKMNLLLLGKPIRHKGPFILKRNEIREIIRESDLHKHMDQSDQKLISSFIDFKTRVAKEIMVPRVDLFSLSSDTTIREASHLFVQEGYSRIPIYKDTLDHIVGVVLYKDLLKFYAKKDQNLDATLETISKPVLYSPENKKASQLLQEFRSKQIHMAIIVDEYGGTEGVVTIEDILEELVGEIEDEYDIDEENPFWEIPGGGWMIDAKMTLIDIQDQIGISIPTHPEYETLGGFIYHFAGTIPGKGWRFSHDKFDLEVISSNERAIKKIKIVPRDEEDN